jgi:hypothetical protein
VVSVLKVVTVYLNTLQKVTSIAFCTSIACVSALQYATLINKRVKTEAHETLINRDLHLKLLRREPILNPHKEKRLFFSMSHRNGVTNFFTLHSLSCRLHSSARPFKIIRLLCENRRAIHNCSWR